MHNPVYTTKGLIERDRLETKDIVNDEDVGSRAIATEWYLDGELVRRDVWVSLLVGQALNSEAQELG